MESADIFLLFMDLMSLSYLWNLCSTRAAFTALPSSQVHCRRRNQVMPLEPSVQLWKQRQNTEGLAHVEKWQTWDLNQGWFHTSAEPSACAVNPASCPVSEEAPTRASQPEFYQFSKTYLQNQIKHTYLYRVQNHISFSTHIYLK